MSKNIFIAPGAQVLGDVTMGENVGIWHNAVVRGDCGNISIGNRSNVQDNCTLHTDLGFTVKIGSDVTIGHNAIVHGCAIGDETLIGMGSILLNGAVVGKNCIIGAGSLVTGKMNIPDGSMVYGNPARIIRKVTDEEIEDIRRNAKHYVELMQKQQKEDSDN